MQGNAATSNGLWHPLRRLNYIVGGKGASCNPVTLSTDADAGTQRRRAVLVVVVVTVVKLRSIYVAPRGKEEELQKWSEIEI